MAVDRIAQAHYRRQVALARRAANEVLRLWGNVDRAAIAASWRAVAQAALIVVAGAQTIAAAEADGYAAEAVDALGLADTRDGDVDATAFAGVASDGRDLASLLYQPAITALAAIAQGVDVDRAMTAGAVELDMIVRTQVADAGRVADGVAIVVRPAVDGYVRVLSLPSCDRCIILAGRIYEWNDGFARHPRCDCRHVPVSDGDAEGILTDPQAVFASLSEAEQDRVFTKAGAQAIREGADMARVVNARRGMYEAGGRMFTTEATTRRGTGRAVRLMPEQIYREADGDRGEAVRLLRAHGYLTGAAPARQAGSTQAQRPQPAAARPEPERQKTLAEHLASGVASREPLAGGQNNAGIDLVTFGDGTRAVKKTAKTVEGVPARTQQDAEELAAGVLRALGLRSPEVHRASARVVYMEYLDGQVAASLPHDVTSRVAGGHYDTDDGRILGLADLLMENYDRNSGNWLVGKDGRLQGIDHGFAFATMKDPARFPANIYGFFEDHYRSADGFRWADNDLSPVDIVSVRDRLLALRPEFQRLGHTDWHDNMLARLDVIGRHAKGTRRRLP